MNIKKTSQPKSPKNLIMTGLMKTLLKWCHINAPFAESILSQKNSVSKSAQFAVGRTKEGQVFEVQIHSRVSLDIKGKTHVLYNKSRDPATTEEERHKLSEEMKRIARTMPRPKGIESIKSFKIK